MTRPPGPFIFFCLQSSNLSVSLSDSFINSPKPTHRKQTAPLQPSAQGWILDGIPETREQALAIQTRGIVPRHVSEWPGPAPPQLPPRGEGRHSRAF